MTKFPSRLLKEICTKPTRLFTHAVVYGLAALQFGCASIKTYSNEPSLPPETRAAILADIVKNTNGRQFRVMEAEKFNEFINDVRDTWRDSMKHASSDSEEVKEYSKVIEKRIDKMKAYLRNNTTKLGHGENAGNNGWENDIDFGWFMRAAAHQSSDGSSAKAVTLSYEPDGMRLFILEKPEKLLEPSPLERTFFKQSIGVADLDEVFGEDMGLLLRVHTNLHEAAHIGDTRNLSSNEQMSYEDRLIAPLKQEIFADQKAFEKLCAGGKNIEFMKMFLHIRALNAAILGDPDHATFFKLGGLLKSFDPTAESYPDLDEKSTYRAITLLSLAQENIETSFSFLKSNDTLVKEISEARYKELANFITGEYLTPQQIQIISNPDVQEVLSAAHKAWLYFDAELQKHGKHFPVKPPPLQTKPYRNIPKVKLPSSPAASGRT